MYERWRGEVLWDVPKEEDGEAEELTVRPWPFGLEGERRPGLTGEV